MSLAIGPEDVRAAAERIRPLAWKTPVLTSETFDAEAGVKTFLKCENLQRGGAFKIRGAANMVLSLGKEALSRGVVAYSSGNHAQATAIAAKHLGVPATIVMPEDAPRSKI
jgi:threonine dehydratase